MARAGAPASLIPARLSRGQARCPLNAPYRTVALGRASRCCAIDRSLPPSVAKSPQRTAPGPAVRFACPADRAAHGCRAGMDDLRGDPRLVTVSRPSCLEHDAWVPLIIVNAVGIPSGWSGHARPSRPENARFSPNARSSVTSTGAAARPSRHRSVWPPPLGSDQRRGHWQAGSRDRQAPPSRTGRVPR
jgi:hypothetical protein